MNDHSTFLLTPATAAYLGQFVMAVIYLATFLSPRRLDRSDAAIIRILQWGFVLLALFALTGIMETGFQRGPRVLGAYLRPTVGMLCGWILLRYAYHFLNPEGRFRTLYRSLLALTTVCLAYEFWTLINRLYHLLQQDRVQWKTDLEGLNTVVVQLLPVALAGVRWIDLASVEARSRGWTAALLHPMDRRVRAIRLLTLLFVTFTGFALIESVDELGVPDWMRHFSTGFGVFIACFFLGYLSMSEFKLRFSLGARIRGLIAVATLTILIMVALISYFGMVVKRDSRTVGRATAHFPIGEDQSLLWSPLPDGFRVTIAEPSWQPTGEVEDVQPEIEDLRIRLPFDFPFGDTDYRDIVVDKNGIIGLGTNTFHYADFKWRPNAGPLIAPGYIDLNPSTAQGGHMIINLGDDRVVVTWSRLGAWVHPMFRPEFQAVLHRDGRIQFNYRSLTYPDVGPGESRPLMEFIGVIRDAERHPVRLRMVDGRISGPDSGHSLIIDITSEWCQQFWPFSASMVLLIVLTPILLAIAAERILRRTILRPLDRLVAAVGSMNEGRLVQSLPVVADDEIGFLTEGFNRMSASVAAATAALERQRDQLEEEVRLRTRDLEAELVERREAERRADAANRAKSDFLSNMSHELRTPLGGVIGMTSLLLETQLDDSQREFASTAQEAAGALLSVVGDILDFSKIEAGHVQLSPTPFKPADLMKEVASILSAPAESRRLEICICVDPQVPQSVIADMGRVRQVVLNLMGNAVKFTEFGHVQLTLTAEPRTDGRTRLVWTVQDTGPGIPPEALKRLFSPFEQGDASTARRFGGTGLGLAISRRLANLMGGTVECESHGGRGSTFTFSMDAVVESGPVPPPDLSSTPLQIAVISESEVIRTCLADQLSACGLPPATSYEAIGKAVRSQRPPAAVPFDWVFVDRPVRDPFPLTQLRRLRLAPQFAQASILLLTPKSTALSPEMRLDLGINARLYKPWLLADMVQWIHRSPSLDEGLRAVRTPGTKDALKDNEWSASPVAPDAGGGLRTGPGGGDAVQTRVLVVDDNKINRRLATLLLQRLHLDPLVASSGLEALGILGGSRVDVVLMDCQMPEIDGYEASRRIRADPARYGDPYIVAFTADADNGNEILRRQAGMEDTLIKPFRSAGMKEVLDRAVEALARRRRI